MNKIKYVMLSLAIVILIGCTTIMETGDKGSTVPTQSVAVIVGLTELDYNAYNGWDGRCAGSNTDLNRMVKACKAIGIKRVVSLYNEQATAYGVMRQIMLASKALEPAAKAGKRPLLFFYYSGHGGAVYDFFMTEKDLMDQTLCLWDGQLLDNLFWQVLLKIPEGITFVHITDTCNSGTNFKLAPSMELLGYAPNKIFRARHRLNDDKLKCDFIHFGGCADGETSNGSVTYGGMFTYILMETVKPDNKSYYQWFIEAEAEMSKIGQIPTITVIQSEESIFNNGKVEDLPALK